MIEKGILGIPFSTMWIRLKLESGILPRFALREIDYAEHT
jgi:hypothetical protein